jgi:hypothetical protein
MLVTRFLAKLAIIFSVLLVSLHTSPMAHAGAMGGPLAQRHECSDHVHQTGDRHEAPQPKALLSNLSAIHDVVAKRIASERAAWDDAPTVFLPSSEDAIGSRAMRPPIPPPTA